MHPRWCRISSIHAFLLSKWSMSFQITTAHKLRYWNKLLDIKTFVQPAWSQINVYQILKTLTTSSWVFLDTCLENLTPKRLTLFFGKVSKDDPRIEVSEKRDLEKSFGFLQQRWGAFSNESSGSIISRVMKIWVDYQPTPMACNYPLVNQMLETSGKS